jgi:hypothetical protein
MIPKIEVTVFQEGVLLECNCPQNGKLRVQSDDFELAYLIKGGYELAIKEGYELLKKYNQKKINK